MRIVLAPSGGCVFHLKVGLIRPRNREHAQSFSMCCGLHQVWLTDPETALPQYVAVELKYDRGVVLRTLGWFCWHAYSTNPGARVGVACPSCIERRVLIAVGCSWTKRSAGKCKMLLVVKLSLYYTQHSWPPVRTDLRRVSIVWLQWPPSIGQHFA